MDQLITSAVKELWRRGLVPPSKAELRLYLTDLYRNFNRFPDEAVFVAECVKYFDLTKDGPQWDWLAYHEAGHVILGLKARLPLRGVRFHCGGTNGVAVLRDPPWQTSANERLLRRLIAIDVAGVVAERVANVTHNGSPSPHQLLSTCHDLYYVHCQGITNDFELAEIKAKHLSEVCHSAVQTTLNDPASWPMRVAILRRAEDKAADILQRNKDALTRLAKELKKGPLSGEAVRRVIGTLN